MKRLLLASTALVLGGQILADQALAVPPAPMFSWTGCYIGANAGAGWNRTGISDVDHAPGLQSFAPVGGSIDFNDTGFVGGGQVGCNYQFMSTWVVGLQGDMSWAAFSSQATDPFFAGKGGNPITLDAKTRWIAAVTGRVGYAWDRVLVYGMGGPAWAGNEYEIRNLTFFGNPTFLCITACNPSGSETRLGWTFGVGVEYALTDQWSVGLAYNHYDFGDHNVTLDSPNGVSGDIIVKQRIDTIRASLNYRFGWMGR